MSIHLIIMWSALALILINSISDALRVLGNGRAEEVYQWTLPFAWIAWLMAALNSLAHLAALTPGEPGGTWNMIALCIQVYFSWASYRKWKNGDDDRWKRLRKKSASTVKDLGHRLIVAPAPANVAA